jgi:signal peptidase I
MTELNLGLSSGSISGAPQESNPPGSGWKKPTIAFLLSLAFPGMGQLYNRQPRRGFVMAALILFLMILTFGGHVIRTYAGFLVSLLVVNGGRLYAVVDAFRAARKKEAWEAAFRYQGLMYSLIGGFILVCAIFPSTDLFLRTFSYIKAYNFPSDSMCPTICLGERFVGEMDGTRKRAPLRGELIIFEHGAGKTLLVKRVIAVGGDVVAEFGKTVLVNGRTSTNTGPQFVCGEAKVDNSHEDESQTFGPVRVPDGSYFVLGDHFSQSYDSRASGFGFVTLNQVRGRPLYIYWSSNFSRVGCSIR